LQNDFREAPTDEVGVSLFRLWMRDNRKFSDEPVVTPFQVPCHPEESGGNLGDSFVPEPGANEVPALTPRWRRLSIVSHIA
jgi:hypothetical protein